MSLAKRRRQAEIPISTLEVVATALRVLAHPIRLKLVELLLIHEELAVGDLAERVDQAPSAVSQHLNMMKNHGLVASRRDGQTAFYRVESPDACNVIDCIRKHHS